MKIKRIKELLCLMLFITVLNLSACSAKEEILFMDDGNSTENGSITEEIMTGQAEEVIRTTEATDENEGNHAEALLQENVTPRMDEPVEVPMLMVHICGAVEKAGVYELTEGSRVMDAVLAAGGFSEEADEEYVNLATLLKDGDKVRIPTKNEVTEMSDGENTQYDSGVMSMQSPINTQSAEIDKVNINTAGEQELCTLPGIGKTRAESILTYRSEHGAFKKIEDIMQVSGIKESSFQKIKDRITVE